MSDICLCYFKFNSKTTPKEFYRYRVTNSSPRSIDALELNNQVRYKIISNFQNYISGKRMFVYSDRSENYIYTYNKIKFVPDLSDKKATIELVDRIEMPVAENTDLYEEWIKYFVYCNMFNCKKYDCHAENHFYLDIQTPKNNLGITLRRDFVVKSKVMPDGTAYIGFDISTQYYSYINVHERFMRGENLIGMEVKCKWQGFDRTYIIENIYGENINETVNGFNLYDYWKELQPYRLKGIDPNNTKIFEVFDSKENRRGKYIPQSLYLVFRRETVAQRDSKFSKETDKFTKLSMSERLDIMREFLNDLNSKTSGIISSEPIDAKELNYDVYDANKNAPKLLVGNNRKINFDNKYQVFSNGFYRMPSNNIVVCFVYLEENKDKCRKAAIAIMNYLNKGLINGGTNKYLKAQLLPIKISSKSYSYRNGDSLELKEIAEKIKVSNINFVICFVPFKFDESECTSEKSPYEVFKKAFADINKPSQIISENFLNVLGTSNVNWYMQNIALGILSKSGGVPWIFSQPFNDVDCFVGLDVSTQQKGIHYPACSVCLDGYGNFLGYYTTTRAQQGEKISPQTLEDIFDRILGEYRKANGHYPKHIVIHRDGFSNESDEWYNKYFSSKSIIYDIVEVKKNISERLLDIQNTSNGMNPNSGMCIIKENKAIIVSTQRNASYGGAPQPLEIVHKHGNIPMYEIVRQIYALSELHVGSIKSTRLPMTTYYADRICKAHDYVPKDSVCCKLYFL